MASRFAAALFVAALLVTLFLPAGVAAAGAAEDDGTVAAATDADALVVDRVRTNVAAPRHARDAERADGRPSDGPVRREDADGVLEQPTRAAVYRAIRDGPGATLNRIADSVGVTKSTVRYHARMLREAGLVDATEVSGALRYAPADADVELHAALNADGTGAVLEAVADREPASVTELARATDRAPSTVSHHLSALEERGLVERERAGERVVTTLSGTAMPPDDAAPADD
jgi:DNA-binding transcriptional ArsR family regulator